MKYVQSTQVDKQKAMMSTDPTHYIYVLDESSSMDRTKWQDLINAFSNSINLIKNIENS